MIDMYFGNIGCGKSEWQRIQTGMTHQEYNDWFSKALEAHDRVIIAERELREAKAAYFAACSINRKPR